MFGATVWLTQHFGTTAAKCVAQQIQTSCVESDVPSTVAGFEKSKIFDEWLSVKILQ